MSELEAEFRQLQSVDSGSAVEKRRRGFAFEKLLRKLLDAEALAPRLNIRPSGEEIDGSICFDGRFFLLEAKWHANPLPASAIYAFKGKVDGKLAGTIGLFISMSGYSEDAVDALTAGKNLNVILFDGNDIEAFFTHSFREVLLAKLRAAAEKGVVFFPFTSTATAVGIAKASATTRIPTQADAGSKQIVVVCEGRTDVDVLSILAGRILASENLSGNIRFVAAQGKRNVPRLINSIQPIFATDTTLIVVVDGDSDTTATRTTIESEADCQIANLIVVEPELEAWGAPGHASPRREIVHRARDAGLMTHAYFAQYATTMPIDTLRSSDPSFAAFYNAIVEAADAA